MPVLAILGGGWNPNGLFRFECRAEALLHPIVQMGDTIAAAPSDLASESLDWPAVQRLAGLEPVDFTDESASLVWDGLLHRAAEPPAPTDAGAIFVIVAKNQQILKRREAAKDTDDTRLWFAVAPNGELYDTEDNNPYPRNVKIHHRWKVLYDGISIFEAATKGFTRPEVNRCLRQGLLLASAEKPERKTFWPPLPRGGGRAS